MSGKKKDRVVRFWSKVLRTDNDSCWIWTASRKVRKNVPLDRCYGQFDGKNAHHVSWELEHGPVGDGLVVCHSCDNPPCVRPSHLFVATQRQNLEDMDRKNRRAKGESVSNKGSANGRARLSESDVVRIRELYAAGGHTQKELGKMFGMRQGKISAIVRRALWRHI